MTHPIYSMKFKEWLFNEDDAGSIDGPGGEYWDLVYHSTPGHYGRASLKPKHHWWMQWRIERGLEIGRPVYNIDAEDFINRKYTSVVSSTAPSAKPGFWEHKPDDGRGYTKPIENVKLHPIGIGPCADTCGEIIAGEPLVTHGFKDTFPLHTKGDGELNRLFGDKAGKWPEISDSLR
tara:strand:- start:24379 stop:24909 length:531 start_codon:yes stop_codon:yes gene_type:complete